MAPRIAVIEQAIDLNTIFTELVNPANGAQLLFAGAIRDLNDGRKVVAVSYDVLSPRAERVIAEICGEAEALVATPLSLLVLQRRGRIQAGQPGIAIGVGAPHRDEAYRASRHLIEQIKARAPIWKKEHYADGDSEWLKGHAAHG